LLLFSFIFLLSFMILKPSSALVNNGSDLHINLKNETIFSDFECWKKYSLFNDNFQKKENCFINNNSNKNLIFLGDSSVASIAKNVIQNNLFKKYNIYFLSILDINFFKDFNNYNNCNSCFLKWIQNNPSTIVISVELHRYIELNGNYYSNLYSNKNLDVFKENLIYLKKHSEELLLIEPFPTIPLSKINPVDLLRIVGMGVIKEIYIPYSYWINNTRLTTETQFVLENNFDIKIVQTNDLFCKKIENKCFIFNDELLYLDESHLNISGGQLITERLSTHLEK